MTERSEVAASVGGRWAAYHEYLNAVPAVGWFGLGPGLFQVAFPYQTSPLGNVSDRLARICARRLSSDRPRMGLAGHAVVVSFGRGRPLSGDQDLFATRAISQQDGSASGLGRHPRRLRHPGPGPDRFSAAGAVDPAVFSCPSGLLLGIASAPDGTDRRDCTPENDFVCRSRRGTNHHQLSVTLMTSPGWISKGSHIR